MSFLKQRGGKFDFINAAQWLIAAASLLLLAAIWEREQQRDELALAERARSNMELTLYRERDQHRAQFDGMLDEINRLKGADEQPADQPAEPELDAAGDAE